MYVNLIHMKFWFGIFNISIINIFYIFIKDNNYLYKKYTFNLKFKLGKKLI
jgi:hypothetical protein